jgi:hypothetical protein
MVRGEVCLYVLEEGAGMRAGNERGQRDGWGGDKKTIFINATHPAKLGTH